MSANKVSICASNPCDPKCQDLYCTKHTFSDPFFTLRSVWWPHIGECDKGKKTKKLPPIPTFCLQGSTNQKKLVLKELCVLKKRGATMTSFEVELRGCTKSQYKRNIMILNCGWWKCGSFGSTGMDGEGIESKFSSGRNFSPTPTPTCYYQTIHNWNSCLMSFLLEYLKYCSLEYICFPIFKP